MDALIALDFMQDLGKLEFVIAVFAFSYVLFWLYQTFSEIPVLFGISSLVAFWFLLNNPFGVSFLVVVFFAVFIFGNMLQQILYFGLFPALNILGIKTPQMGMHPEMESEMQLQEIQKKLMNGKELSDHEAGIYKESLVKQARMGQAQNQYGKQIKF